MDTFYRIDILRALLQHTGTRPADITTMLHALEKQAATAAAFHAWNCPLDHRGSILLRQLTDPSVKPVFIAACAQTVHAACIGHFDTSHDGQRLLDALRSLF